MIGGAPYADDYIRPYIGDRRVRDITPEVILAWQRKLLKEGGAKKKTGRAVGSPRLEAEGRGDQVEGNLGQAGAKVKDAFKH